MTQYFVIIEGIYYVTKLIKEETISNISRNAIIRMAKERELELEGNNYEILS